MPNPIQTQPSANTTKFRDSLTGLLNMDGFFDAMEHRFSRFVHSAIIHFDVDDFKSFNEQYGFMGGNQFLQSIGEELRILFIDSIIARTGGDHFVVATMQEQAEDRVVLFQERMKEHTRNMQIFVKAGIYYPASYDRNNAALFIDRAKLACDSIKHTYDKSYCIYDISMERTRQFRHSIITGFDEALTKGYIRPYYQPHVRLLTGERCGYEALARWVDEDHGMISPAIFIEILEEAHLIHLLDLHIIEQVCRDLRYVMDQGLNALPVSVNLSRLDFYLCNIFMEIETIRQRYSIPTRYLHIEVTESALTDGSDFLLSEIPRFHEAGYEVWMDDFGSGYSSLNNLMRYPFDLLKIDMNFLREFDSNPKTRVILAAIVRMAKNLSIHTLAEGVETQEQYDFLKEIGCEKIQGYLKGRPSPFSKDLVKEALAHHTRHLTTDGSTTELPELSSYYSAIGMINVLSTAPLAPRGRMPFQANAIVVLEYYYEDEAIHYLYANAPYRALIRQAGYNMDWSQTKMPFIKDDLFSNPIYRDLVRRCKESHEEETEIAQLDGIEVTISMKVVAELDDRITYALVFQNHSRSTDYSGDTQLPSGLVLPH